MAEMKFKTIMQGAVVDDLISQIDPEAPSDEEIDLQKPFRYDILITINNKKQHLMFEVGMLTEDTFYKFLKNFNYMKTKIESILNMAEEEERKIDETEMPEEEIKNKEEQAKTLDEAKKQLKDTVWTQFSEFSEFKHTFSDIIVSYSRCLNPELIISEDIKFIFDVKYKDEIANDQYFTLFRELLNISHPIVSLYFNYDTNTKHTFLEKLKHKRQMKKLNKQFMKNKITYKEYINEQNKIAYAFSKTNKLRKYFDQIVLEIFKSFSLSYLKSLSEDIISSKINDIFSSIRIDKLLPIFYKIIWYNEYLVKKNLQKTLVRIMNRMDLKLRLTSLSGMNLDTKNIGGKKYPEFKFIER